MCIPPVLFSYPLLLSRHWCAEINNGAGGVEIDGGTIYDIAAASCNRSRAPGPREVEYHRRIRRTIARKLLYRRAPFGTRARARTRLVPKNANYEFLRCISNGESRMNAFFSSFSSPRPHSLSRSLLDDRAKDEEEEEEARCWPEEAGTSPPRIVARGTRRRNFETTAGNS